MIHKSAIPAGISLGIEIREGFMGKKKAQKNKELAMAIDEASSIGDESGQSQSHQPQTLRKRGRPRKIVEKKDGVEQLAASSVDAAEESLEKPLEKNKSSEGEQREFPQLDSWIKNEVGVSSQEKQLPEGEPSRSRKARRKSKPRKSS